MFPEKTEDLLYHLFCGRLCYIPRTALKSWMKDSAKYCRVADVDIYSVGFKEIAAPHHMLAPNNVKLTPIAIQAIRRRGYTINAREALA